MSEQVLTQILSELKEIKTTMATKEELNDLKQTVVRMEEKQETIDERIGEIEEKLDATREQVVKNAEAISSMRNEQQQIKQAVLETSSDVKTLMTSQAKQDKILERLSVRSIEQEADIDELRRIK